MPARKKTKTNDQEEQIRLLRQILAELQALNASLAAGKTGMQADQTGTPAGDDDSGNEELEEYE